MEEKKLSWQDKCKKRQWSNKKILELINDIVEKYPDLRFWQIMCILGYETNPDRFYEESYDTYQQMLAMKEANLRNNHTNDKENI